MLEEFVNSKFGKIRVLYLDGEPWFVGKDVTICLGYRDTYSAIRKNVDFEDKRTLTEKQIQQMAAESKVAQWAVLETESPRGLTLVACTA